MKRIRNSNIEILRIISMIFIVLSHYTVHNGISNLSATKIATHATLAKFLFESKYTE